MIFERKTMENNKFKPIDSQDGAWKLIRNKRMLTRNTTADIPHSVQSIRNCDVNFLRKQKTYCITESEFSCYKHVILDMHYESIPGSDDGVWVSNPCKFINHSSLIIKISGLDSNGYATQIDCFQYATIGYLLKYYYEYESEIHFVLLNDGLVCIIKAATDIAKYLSGVNNGKIQILINYKQNISNINDPASVFYNKFLVSENNLNKLYRWCISFKQIQELGIDHWFANKYTNSYICDIRFIDNQFDTLIGLTNIENFCDNGSMVCSMHNTLVDNWYTF